MIRLGQPSQEMLRSTLVQRPVLIASPLVHPTFNWIPWFQGRSTLMPHISCINTDNKVVSPIDFPFNILQPTTMNVTFDVRISILFGKPTMVVMRFWLVFFPKQMPPLGLFTATEALRTNGTPMEFLVERLGARPN